ncbi:MAG: HAMP domain-containing protein [Magnetococcales bacterium]|nr:HAMP domain-containing protein [Magnetococcales bacterium]
MRLFLKFFLSFWLTALLVGISVGWISYQLRGELDEIVSQELAILNKDQLELADYLKENGIGRLKERLASHPQKKSIYLLKPDKTELFGRAIPRSLTVQIDRMLRWKKRKAALAADPMNRLTSRTMDSTPTIWKNPKSHFPHPLSVIGPDGQRYILGVSPSQFHLLSRPFSRHPMILLLILGISGLVFFILARHFSRPIQNLRETSLQLAKGNLQARSLLKKNRIPDELSDFGREFNFMADRLEALFHAQKRLLRDVSHELRSPLARMRAALGLLEQESREKNQNHLRLEKEVENLDRLIGQIITLSRPDQPGLIDLESWLDLGELIRSIVTDAIFEDTRNKSRLVTDIPESIILQADGQRLHSALENVIRNALLHTPEEGIVTIAASLGPRWVTLTVSDQGEGVDQALLPHLFEPFFRTDDARDRKRGGFGLGLAIASKAIREHGGEIRARNRSGGGLEMVITLPMKPEP